MDGLDSEHENIDDVENAVLRVRDLVAREVGVQKLACHTSPVNAPATRVACGTVS